MKIFVVFRITKIDKN